MKNFLKKFHIVSNQSDTIERSNSLRGHQSSEHNKPFTGLSGWLHSVTNKHVPSTPSSSNETQSDRMEASDNSVSLSGVGLGADIGPEAAGSSNSTRDPDIEEEYQIQLALELSAREDPEAVQIEAIKQISLGSCSVDNTPAEVVAYRYWNYNALGYDDKIMDGFYDLYGVLHESTFGRMPSLIDLQGTPIADTVTWEAILVNRSGDSTLLKLEHKAVEIALKSRSDPLVSQERALVRNLAILVSDYMGGAVKNPESMLREWRSLDYRVKATIGSMVLPLGSLTIGLARHRALLFKVLADTVGIPCQLVKGQQYTGSADVAMVFVKIDDGREYIVDLMADPGTLIPSDVAGLLAIGGASQVGSFSTGETSSFEEQVENKAFHLVEGKDKELVNNGGGAVNVTQKKTSPEALKDPRGGRKHQVWELPNYPYSSHARSPSWTEGVTLPAAHRMKVRDVSQYMIDAAEENPQLAQKLHDVLLESGVVAPPNLFGEINPKQLDVNRQINQETRGNKKSGFLPPLPHPKGVGVTGSHHPSQQLDETGQPADIINPVKYTKNVPVAAAAAAAAAVVASSMVVAAAKSSAESSLELPVAAAAAMVATTAAVNKQIEQIDGGVDSVNTGSGENRKRGDALEMKSDSERVSDRSTGEDSGKSDVGMDDVADYEIQWEEITLGERIGLGSYGEVYHGDWHGTEVAVKRFLDQDISGESLEEFKSEIRIMKKVRHPNVVLFMGAITRVPNLSIVTEFLPRGSLYRLLHRPNNQLDERRRLRMALDAARGMNYLHNCNPVIVHRDLKSPNLLVDKNWVVKVCDFGLSRIKHDTYLSSCSTAGTAEWMAPEVLRNELSDEKCDVYSFGVILWELCTLQQPWGGMNPMQVVGAVGFQHRRLEIPKDMDPAIADIILKCWQTDAKLRPTFAQIMAALKPLQKPITSSQVPRTATSASSRH